MPRLLLVFLIALLAPAALAQTCTTSWTNPAGGVWEAAGNWSDGLPDGQDTACITLAGTYTVSQSSADRAVGGLVVGGASGTQTLTTFNRFSVLGNSVVRPSGRWELLNRVPGGEDGLLTTGTVTVEGVFVQNGGTTLLDGGGVFDVAPGGRWEVRDQVSAGIQARPGTYRLRGTLDAAYTSTQNINLPLDVQGGTIRVSQGRLDIAGGTLANATVDAAAGATLLLVSTAAAPFTVSGTLSGAPAGEAFFNGGTFAATSSEVTLAVGGAGLLLGGNVALTGGAFRNTGLVTVANGGFNALDGTTLRNTGRFVMNGSTFSLRTGAHLRNEAAGTLEVSNQGGVGFNGGFDGRIENAGLLLANGSPAGPGSGATAGTINVPYDGLPGSVVRVQTGRLDLNVGGTLRDVTFDVPAGAVVLMSTGASTDELVITGTVSGTLAGDLVIASAERVGAGPGGATFAVGGTGLQFQGADGNSFTRLVNRGGTFTNTGVMVWSGASVDGVVLENRGTLRLLSRFNLANGSATRNVAGATTELFSFMEGNGRFDNAGLVVTGGTGFSVSFGGRLRSLPGSELRALAGGPRLDLDAPGSRNLPDGSALTGTGVVLFNTGLEPEGTVSPGTDAQPLATLSSFNAYRPSLVAGSPRLVIDVDAGGQSDVFALGGGATRLGGALVVRVQPGYTPAVGDQWTVLTNGTSAITGQFGQVVAEGAPSEITFVTEVATGGTSIVVRAVATAPGGPVTLSATRFVGGAVRPVFLTGPGASGVAAVRLECTACLDAAAFGTLQAVLVGDGALREARFDLTDPRAFGLYDLVMTRPGLADERVPVTVRPYLAYVVSSGGIARGARVRPPGNGYNWSTYNMAVRANDDAGSFSLPRMVRADSVRYALALSSGNAFVPGVVVFYESVNAADPQRAPVGFGRIEPGTTTPYSFGLRISPEDVRFPEQQAVPNDPRIPFGAQREVRAVGTQHLSQARTLALVGEALRTSDNAQLTAYIAQVDAADPGAVASAFNTAVVSRQAYFTVPQQVLNELLRVLNGTVQSPAGLASGAGDAFERALEQASNAFEARVEAAHADALASAPPAVTALFLAEATALFPDGFPPVPPGPAPRPSTAGLLARDGDNGAESFCRFLGFGDSIDSINKIGDPNGGAASCAPTEGSGDPNDKLADTDLLCEFGTVTVVGGEPETRCVRYFVPRARAAEPVAYTVKFENLAIATAPAEFVTITDDIDPAFDINSLRIESTSSDSTFSYSVSGRTVTFRFTGIDLPPNRTAPEGEGFVRFSLRPTAGLPDGTEIRNDASIVFDFNPAIATPEVLHEIRTVADLGTAIEAPDFVVVGNPVPLRVLVANLRGDAAPAAQVVITTGTAVSSVSTSAGTCTGAGPITCTFGDLEPGTVAAIDLVLSDLPIGQVAISAVTSTTAFDGFEANNSEQITVGIATVGTEDDSDVPRELTLASPRPNPVLGSTMLRWGLPQASSVDIRVYDLLGREVARIADGEVQEAGWHEVQWEASVASGIYVVRVHVGDEVRTRRMTVIR